MLLEPGLPTRVLAVQLAHAEVYECEPEPPALLHHRFLNFFDAHAELELEIIQSQMAQKPMLRGKVGARAWRV